VYAIGRRRRVKGILFDFIFVLSRIRIVLIIRFAAALIAATKGWLEVDSENDISPRHRVRLFSSASNHEEHATNIKPEEHGQ
jgi:hypothetical protein